MNTISSLSYLALGFLDLWQIILFFGSAWILVMSYREKQRKDPALRRLLGFLMVFFNYFSFQFTADRISTYGVRPWVVRLERFYGETPAVIVTVVCILMTVLEVMLLLSSQRFNRTHITSFSIKEAIETLPVGICAYEQSGKVTLKNTTMEQLCRSLTNEALLNGNAFSKALEEGEGALVEHTVELPGFGVWSFRKDHIGDKQNDLSLIIAYNVTEVYRKTQTLNEKRKAVEQLNERLTAYNKRIEAVVAEKEILSAKIRIHDELGTDLLAIKRCLAAGGSDQVREEILARAGRNIAFLLEKDAKASDEYELMLTTAEALGVTVEIDGLLPETEPHKHIIATAIHECLTNTLRHAHGDLLHIAVKDAGENIDVEFTNNGLQPEGIINEKGGLASLRTLIEGSLGCMIIKSVPQFTLTVSLPKEESGDVL